MVGSATGLRGWGQLALRPSSPDSECGPVVEGLREAYGDGVSLLGAILTYLEQAESEAGQDRPCTDDFGKIAKRVERKFLWHAHCEVRGNKPFYPGIHAMNI